MTGLLGIAIILFFLVIVSIFALMTIIRYFKDLKRSIMKIEETLNEIKKGK